MKLPEEQLEFLDNSISSLKKTLRRSTKNIQTGEASLQDFTVKPLMSLLGKLEMTT